MNEMMEICKEHIRQYPDMEVQDMIKLIYQSVYGGDHMIADAGASLCCLKEELEKIAHEEHKESGAVFEPIGHHMYRFYLDRSKMILPPETVNRMFVESSKKHHGTKEEFRRCIHDFFKSCEDGIFPYTENEAERFYQIYVQQGEKSIHHSERYVRLYHPAYRVLSGCYAAFYPVFTELEKLLAGSAQTIVVAVDGRCGSGKTTLGDILEKIYDCNVIRMDDFFLPWERKTKERLLQPGGNVDYERFMEEVAAPLADRDKSGRYRKFSYRPFNCQTQAFGEEIFMDHKRLNIIEGSYCQHPYFGNMYNLRFFVDVDKDEQRRRILKRNGEEMLKRFEELWIPLEEQYFSACRIREQSLYVKNNEKI